MINLWRRPKKLWATSISLLPDYVKMKNDEYIFGNWQNIFITLLSKIYHQHNTYSFALEVAKLLQIYILERKYVKVKLQGLQGE